MDCRSGKTAYRLVDYFRLESNIGLNAIAQWCATFDNPLPQGLGTGQLFTDNVEMPLEVRKRFVYGSVMMIFKVFNDI